MELTKAVPGSHVSVDILVLGEKVQCLCNLCAGSKVCISNTIYGACKVVWMFLNDKFNVVRRSPYTSTYSASARTV